MRKETINTFSDGMSLDLNPLGTPAKTLTNCLNGTLITYNGNELTLQNDMGNVPVGTAALPKGYVPVGMKEYGGIIYVASYNPETGKGQLGCFPSPLLIYVSEAALTTLEINLQTEFIGEFWNNVPIIEYNEYKSEIFKDSEDLQPKIFNTGDRFIIKTEDNFSDELREAIDKNIITIKLFIIPTSGGEPIDISNCENNELNLYQEVDKRWQKNLWIFLNGGNLYEDPDDENEKLKAHIPFETILSTYRQFLLSYPGPQGTLEIVFEFNTFKLFNLYRNYKKNEGTFDVQFVGEAQPDDLDVCNPVMECDIQPLLLYGKIDDTKHDITNCELLGEATEGLIAYTNYNTIHPNKYLYYDIMPTSKYGALKLINNTFLKSGELSVESINNAHNKITNWDFEIDNDAITIKWTYTTFIDDPTIDHMRFVLIPLDKISDPSELSKTQIDNLYITGINTPDNVPNIYKILKLIYSGDFEDRIEFVKDKVEHNYIYLCRLDVIYKNGTAINGQEYKLLYTGTFFNDKNIKEFNKNNRPIVKVNTELVVELLYTIKSFNYTLISDIDGEIKESEPREVIYPNDIMFKADNEKYYRKIIGVIINVECEVTSILGTKCDKFVEYNNEKSEMRPYYAGNFDSDLTLDALAINGEINCKIQDVTKPLFEGEGDEETLLELQKRIKEATIITNGREVPLDGATITYVKEGTTYKNTSTIKIHRGIISRLGEEDFYTVSLEGLFPVYDPEDTLYNEKLFGFNLDEDGNLSNIIGANRFTGLALWLAKNREIDATTMKKDTMIEYERKFRTETALSTYDFKEEERLAPYHYGSYISEGVGIVNLGSVGTSRIEAMQYYNYAPILIIASNEYCKIWDSSYWDGDVDSRITNLMCLPHSDIYEYLEDKLNVEDHELHGREKYYGRSADHIRNNYILTDSGININSIGKEKRSLFHTSHGMGNSMYILWRSQYGYLIMNVSTSLSTEFDSRSHDLITVKPIKDGGKVTSLKVEVDDSQQYQTNETHLRADHMLLCMLSLILIAKKRNSEFLLNAPNVSLIYQSSSFKTKGILTVELVKNPVIALNGKNIEDLINILLNNQVLDFDDIYIPMFYSDGYSNGKIDCGGKISTNTDRFGMVNLEDLFYAEGLPEFSTITDLLRVNIYPGVITSVFGTYLCQLEKDRFGLYKVNEKLLEKDADGNEKFYKIFLPVIHSHTNKKGAKYNCTNTEIYKEMLEGFAYNDVLLPTTKILLMLGKPIQTLNSLESIEDPFFNLLYYNSINLKWHMLYINGGCPDLLAPTDYSHGFAFISLFGDQSRFLDALVWRKNSIHGLDETEMEVNVGFYNEGNPSDMDCQGRFVYWKRPYTAWKTATCPEDLFILGTEDWSSAYANYESPKNISALITSDGDTIEIKDDTLTDPT